MLKTYLLYSDYELITSLEKYIQHQGPKFSYSSQPNESGLHFHASELLTEKGINEPNLKLGEHNGLVTLFHHQKPDAILPYDPFAACFYMLSRYEEYLPHLKDKYDRFSAKDSVAKKHSFLQTAVVDRWALQVKEVLKAAYPELKFGNKKFNFIPTIDIDNAFAFKHKGFSRIVGSLCRSLLTLNFERLLIQLKVVFGNKQDPFNTYNYQLNLQKKYHLKPIYFFLLGDYGLNDKNISHENKHFQSLIKSIADYAKVGIHPSFGSNQKPDQLQKEIKRLAKIVKREIFCSRQHYLKLSLPETYRNLVKEDILEDYTMGYADALGFRSGTCTPYYFYDLDEEMEVNLKVFPFQVMESTFKYYLNTSIEESITLTKTIIDEVRAVNGTFISLWHNESLSDELEWKGWRKVYEAVIEASTNTSN